MEFTAVHSSETTNTSCPYYRWPPISLPSGSFPPLWMWGNSKQIWSLLSPAQNPSEASTALKKLELPSMASPRLPWPGQPLSLSTWGCGFFYFPEVLSLLWACPRTASSPTTSKSLTGAVTLSFISYLKPHPKETFPDLKPGQIPKHSGLDHHQTSLRFLFNVCLLHQTVSQLRQGTYLCCSLAWNVWLWASV